jgi:hypothetical protein
MPRLYVPQAFVPRLILVCLVLSGAPQSFVEAEPPASARANQQRERSTSRTAGEREPAHARVHEAYGKLPLSFEVNRGQTDPQVKFLSRGPGYTLFLTATDAVLSLAHSTASRASDGGVERPRAFARALEPTPVSERTALRMRVVGANQRARVSGHDELPGKVNYLRGSDPTRWQTQVPTYAKVGYENVYPGIDLVYYGNQRELEYDFIVAPGADSGLIALTFEGADAMDVDGAGNLILQTGAGRLIQRAPRVYQEINGVQQTIPSRYRVDIGHAKQSGSSPDLALGDRVVRFAVGDYDHSRALVIDPVLMYSTYLGGTASDQGAAIAVDSTGSAYVTGTTNSNNFPTTAAAFDTTFNGNFDAFVTKLNANGTALVYSTYLGGVGIDQGYGIAVDSAGSAYVTGSTESSDWPTTPGAFDTILTGGRVAFVAKLDASGASLAYSTYIGGGSIDSAYEIALSSTGNAYVTGDTFSSNFPTTTGVFDTTLGGSGDAFVTKLQASGAALAYSTYLGGSGVDSALGIAVDDAGSAYVTGLTPSSDFPTTPGAFDTTKGASYDAFVTKLAPGGASLAYSTFLGGAGDDLGYAIAVDNGGSAYVAGETDSTNFPTTPGAFDTTYGGGDAAKDAFVTKLVSSGAALAYSTYLGDTANESASAIAVDDDGNAHVTGQTGSTNFPTTPDAFDATWNGATDAFVTTLNASGAALVYSTYFGGAVGDAIYGIAVDGAGSAYVTGQTASTNFPTTSGAFDTTFGGASDAFVAKFEEPTATEPDLVVTAVSNPPAVLVLKQKFAVTDSTHNQGAASIATTTRYYLSHDTVRNTGDKRLSGKRAVPGLAAGATSTGTVNVTVPITTKVRVYYLLACADDLKVETESNETNNCRASATTVDVRAPDLVETAVSNPPATAPRGSSFSVTDTATNQGNAPAGPTTTRYYLSKDTTKTNTDPKLSGTRAVPGLAAGANSTGTVTVTIPAATAAATYFVIACADDLKTVFESNELNNCKASATKVSVTP